MVTDAEKRKTIAAARAMVRQMEIRKELDEWLAKAGTPPRIVRKTNPNALVARIVRR